MSQNYTGHFEYNGKLPNEDYKYPIDQLSKISTTPPPSQQPNPPMVQPTSTLSTTIKSYTDHMNDANWNQMYGHHQVYGPPNEYSQMQQNFPNSNVKYWS